MVVFFIVVLISLVFGFVFAKIDTLTKMCKMLKDELSKMQNEIEDVKNKSIS